MTNTDTILSLLDMMVIDVKRGERLLKFDDSGPDRSPSVNTHYAAEILRGIEESINILKELFSRGSSPP